MVKAKACDQDLGQLQGQLRSKVTVLMDSAWVVRVRVRTSIDRIIVSVTILKIIDKIVLLVTIND